MRGETEFRIITEMTQLPSRELTMTEIAKALSRSKNDPTLQALMKDLMRHGALAITRIEGQKHFYWLDRKRLCAYVESSDLWTAFTNYLDYNHSFWSIP